jgi:hypothetical protein
VAAGRVAVAHRDARRVEGGAQREHLRDAALVHVAKLRPFDDLSRFRHARTVAQRASAGKPCYASRIDRRNVKGSLFVDYVRMLRAHKGVDWSPYLDVDDVQYLSMRIHPGHWYPMETFERMGVAILREVARDDLRLVEHFGRVSLDALCKQYDNLVAPGDPHESLVRFRMLRQSFFDFPAITIEDVYESSAVSAVSYGMGAVAEEAATHQTMGFFERLLERAGGKMVSVALTSRAWSGDSKTRIQLGWRMATSSPPPASRGTP